MHRGEPAWVPEEIGAFPHPLAPSVRSPTLQGLGGTAGTLAFAATICSGAGGLVPPRPMQGGLWSLHQGPGAPQNTQCPLSSLFAHQQVTVCCRFPACKGEQM